MQNLCINLLFHLIIPTTLSKEGMAEFEFVRIIFFDNYLRKINEWKVGKILSIMPCK